MERLGFHHNLPLLQALASDGYSLHSSTQTPGRLLPWRSSRRKDCTMYEMLLMLGSVTSLRLAVRRKDERVSVQRDNY